VQPVRVKNGLAVRVRDVVLSRVRFQLRIEPTPCGVLQSVPQDVHTLFFTILVSGLGILVIESPSEKGVHGVGVYQYSFGSKVKEKELLNGHLSSWGLSLNEDVFRKLEQFVVQVEHVCQPIAWGTCVG
jgi:hypothetical protein